jgi:hypothetical protein
VKRLGRMFFGAAVVGSLLVCLLLVGVWVRSYFAFDLVTRTGFSTYHSIGVSRGEVYFYYDVFERHRLLMSGARWRREALAPKDVLAEMEGQHMRWAFGPVMGFYFGHSIFPGEETRISIVPVWGVLIVVGVWPLVAVRGWVGRRRKARRAAMGCCVACGYDLRASAGRCPECGRFDP